MAGVVSAKLEGCRPTSFDNFAHLVGKGGFVTHVSSGKMSETAYDLKNLASEVLENIVRRLPAHLIITRLRTCGNRILWTKLQRYAVTCLNLTTMRGMPACFSVLPTLSALTVLEIGFAIPQVHRDIVVHLSAKMRRLILTEQSNMDCWLEYSQRRIPFAMSLSEELVTGAPLVLARYFENLDTLVIKSEGRSYHGWSYEMRRDFLVGLPSSLTELDIRFGFFADKKLMSDLPKHLGSLAFESQNRRNSQVVVVPASLHESLTRLEYVCVEPRSYQRPALDEGYGVLKALREMTLREVVSHPFSRFHGIVRLTLLNATGLASLNDSNLHLLPKTLTYLHTNDTRISDHATWPLPLLTLHLVSWVTWSSLASLPKTLTLLHLTADLNLGPDLPLQTSLRLFPHLTTLLLPKSRLAGLHLLANTSLTHLELRGHPYTLLQQMTFPTQLTSLLSDYSRLPFDTNPSSDFSLPPLSCLRHFHVHTSLRESHIRYLFKRLLSFSCSKLFYEDGLTFHQDSKIIINSFQSPPNESYFNPNQEFSNPNESHSNPSESHSDPNESYSNHNESHSNHNESHFNESVKFRHPNDDKPALKVTLHLGDRAYFENGAMVAEPTHPASYDASCGVSFEHAISIPSSVNHLSLMTTEASEFGYVSKALSFNAALILFLDIPQIHFNDLSPLATQCVNLRQLRTLRKMGSVKHCVRHWPPFASPHLESLVLPHFQLASLSQSLILMDEASQKTLVSEVAYLDPTTFHLPSTLKELCLHSILNGTPLTCFSDAIDPHRLINLTTLVIQPRKRYLSWQPENLEITSSLFQQLPPSLTSFEYGYQFHAKALEYLKCAPDHLRYFKTVQISDRLVLDMSRFLLNLTCEFVVSECWQEYLHPELIVTEIREMGNFLMKRFEESIPSRTMQLLLFESPKSRHFDTDLIVWDETSLLRLPKQLASLAFSDRCSIRLPRFAHLLPRALFTLVLPAQAAPSLSTANIRHLPRTLQSLECCAKFFSLDTYRFLPPSLTCLHTYGAKKFTARFAAALPTQLRTLDVKVLQWRPSSIQLLPSSLTYLSITTPLASCACKVCFSKYSTPNLTYLKLPTSHPNVGSMP